MGTVKTCSAGCWYDDVSHRHVAIAHDCKNKHSSAEPDEPEYKKWAADLAESIVTAEEHGTRAVRVHDGMWIDRAAVLRRIDEAVRHVSGGLPSLRGAECFGLRMWITGNERSGEKLVNEVRTALKALVFGEVNDDAE